MKLNATQLVFTTSVTFDNREIFYIDIIAVTAIIPIKKSQFSNINIKNKNKKKKKINRTDIITII